MNREERKILGTDLDDPISREGRFEHLNIEARYQLGLARRYRKEGHKGAAKEALDRVAEARKQMAEYNRAELRQERRTLAEILGSLNSIETAQGCPEAWQERETQKRRLAALSDYLG